MSGDRLEHDGPIDEGLERGMSVRACCRFDCVDQHGRMRCPAEYRN